MQIDHLGIAVHSIQEALNFYRDALGLKEASTEDVPGERVRVAMLPLSEGAGSPRVELLQPTQPDSTVARFLEKRGSGLHHVAMRVENLEAAMQRIEAAGGKILNQPRLGAGGHMYVFIHPASAHGVLIELIQSEAVKEN